MWWLRILLVFSFLFSSEVFAGESLSLWVHPYLPATELVKRFSPLIKYLSNELGIPVKIRVHKSYQTHIDFVGRDQADIAYLGPVSYLRVTNNFDLKPLLARLEVRGKPFFHGMIIARNDSTIETLADLAGRSFAFGDPNSTMSHVVPRAHLKKEGIDLADLGKYEYLGSHHDVALGVLGGYFDAGGVKEEVFYEYEQRGLKALAKSPPISEHVFITRADLPTNLVELLRKAFMAINQRADRDKILKSIKKSVTGFAPAVDQDYEGLRQLMKYAEVS